MPINYHMIMTANNEKEKLRFNELPEKINISEGANNESIDISGLGEILVINDRPAITISFESVFSKENSNPQESIETLIKWKNSKKPVHLIVTGFNINLFCAFDSFNYSEQGGDVGSISYSIKLIEYREPKVREIKMVSITKGISTGGENRVDNRIQSASYTVKSGDCLYNIAKAELGSASKWSGIAKINNIKSPYLIYPNQVLKLV